MTKRVKILGYHIDQTWLCKYTNQPCRTLPVFIGLANLASLTAMTAMTAMTELNALTAFLVLLVYEPLLT